MHITRLLSGCRQKTINTPKIKIPGRLNSLGKLKLGIDIHKSNQRKLPNFLAGRIKHIGRRIAMKVRRLGDIGVPRSPAVGRVCQSKDKLSNTNSLFEICAENKENLSCPIMTEGHTSSNFWTTSESENGYGNLTHENTGNWWLPYKRWV